MINTMAQEKYPILKEKSLKRLMYRYNHYQGSELRALLQNPDKFLDAPGTKYLKNNPGDTSTVGVVRVDQISVVIKRYNVKSFTHRLKLWLRPSRAMISWKNTHLLISLDIPTVEPIAVIEERAGPLRGKAYFIYRYAEGTSCSEYFEKQTDLPARFQNALRNIAATLKKMKANYVFHKDLHHNNLVLVGDEVLLVDLDHVKQYRFLKFLFPYLHKKDIAKFMHYLGENQAAKEYFLRALSND